MDNGLQFAFHKKEINSLDALAPSPFSLFSSLSSVFVYFVV
jgi:hypothetical protein